MKILNKIRSLPERNKKIILWSIIIIMAIFLFTFYIQNMKNKIENIEEEKIKQEFQIPRLQEEMSDLFIKFKDQFKR